MLLALGAVSSALDMLQSLTAKKSSSATTGFAQGAPAPDIFGASATPSGSGQASPTAGSSVSGSLSSGTLSALLAAQGQQPASTASMSPQDSLKDLFSQLDADGNGQISKSEFENALGAGGTNVAQADDVFGKMDKNGDGSVSLGEMASSLKGASGHHSHRHHHAGGAEDSSGSASDPLMQALDGASSTTTTNSDGSTTTSLTYADGSKVTLTTPAATTATSTATSSYNFVEQAIQRQAQALSASAASLVSVSA